MAYRGPEPRVRGALGQGATRPAPTNPRNSLNFPRGDLRGRRGIAPAPGPYMHTARLENAVLRPETNEWLQRFAKIGYAVKGLVYGLIGFLAIQVAAGQGGQLAGEHEAVRHVQGWPFGNVALVIIGVGLMGYAVWRSLEGILDVRRVGSDAWGIA